MISEIINDRKTYTGWGKFQRSYYHPPTITQGLVHSKISERASRPKALSTGHYSKVIRMDPNRNRLGSLSRPLDRILRREQCPSQAYTEPSGEMLIKLAEMADKSDRTRFLEEYNNLASEHGIPHILPSMLKTNIDSNSFSSKYRNWFLRNILRKRPSTQGSRHKSVRRVSHKRSFSDVSLQLNAKKEKFKNKDLDELARLCGVSLLYLPTSYAAESLCVPTCFRALAQYLVNHGTTTQGVFQIPGSYATVNELYSYYSRDFGHKEVVSGTVRCPNLPDHFNYDVYDVASAFQKFLAGLPGGILGSLATFNAFLSIKIHVDEDSRRTKSKFSQHCARMIAMAIMAISSRYRRDLICGVFGLLCIIGNMSETSKKDSCGKKSIPISGLMGYGPLSVIFGPILVGDLLEDDTIQFIKSSRNLVLTPISPSKPRKGQKKSTFKSNDERGEKEKLHIPVDKIEIANSVTGMLITYWHDVVCQFKNLCPL